MVVAVFRSRIRSDASTEEIAELGQKMYELVSAMPGFLSYKDFVAEDGENVSIIEFETHEALDAWREHPDHKVAQARWPRCILRRVSYTSLSSTSRVSFHPTRGEA